MDMNIVYTVLIILIIIVIINHLTNNKIIKTITNALHKLKNMITQKTDKVPDINIVLNKISTHQDIKRTIDFSYSQTASKQMIKILGHKLLGALNISMKKYNYKLRNLTVNSNITYYRGQPGKYFKPFYITAKVYYKNKKIGRVSFKIELFVKQNSNDIVILEIVKERKTYTSALTDNIADIQNNQNNNMYNHDNPDNNNEEHFYNEPRNENNIFIKNTQHIDDNNSSLIPSIVNITPYDTACETQSACESTCNTATNTATDGCDTGTCSSAV
jgi:hypothetical protein